MPYLTAARARGEAKTVRGGSDARVHARPYGQTGLTPFKRRLKNAVFSLT